MVRVEETYLPITLSAPGLTDAQFQEFCELYADFSLEYSAEGDLIIMPPTDPDTSAKNMEIGRQLANWRIDHRRAGRVTESSGGFKLPDGARLAAEVALISHTRLVTNRSPEFVIELHSPGDRISKLRHKMTEWIANGVELAWLIDPTDRSVAIYGPGREPETHIGDAAVAGEGPVEGFTLDLAAAWNA
ncbi:MAG: Uma2 family endonuclease [Acidobacteria bacterium]|nr:Uma2 family endonuclease [Acidobacteriota bacterium]